MSYHQASGDLIVSNSTAYFDSNSGLAYFNDILITAKGMYLLTFNLTTDDDLYNFDCYSNLITISDADTSPATYSTDFPPNYILKFEGNFVSIEENAVKASIYNYLVNKSVSLSDMSLYSGSVYASGYSSAVSTSLMNDLSSSGLPIGLELKFLYASVNSFIINFGYLTVNCTNCSIID